MEEKKGRIIVVEGNICCGKSTLSKKICDLDKDYIVFIEPSVGDNPYLTKFYEEPKKYALIMQLFLLGQRYSTYKMAMNLSKLGKTVILDRSIFSDRVFAVQNYRIGNISREGFRKYEKVSKMLMGDLPLPDLILYLDVSPEDCYNRIKEIRCRDCEMTISVEYLRGLEEAYVEYQHGFHDRLIKLDWSKFGSVEQILKAMLDLNKDVSPRTSPRREYVEDKILNFGKKYAYVSS